jgi:rhombotail lipoprotein
MHKNKTLMIIVAILLLNGCSMLGPEKVRHSKTSSLVGFLYPDGNIPADLPSPTLRLPLRVGLAYVPSNGYSDKISQSLKMELLNNIKAEFQHKRYIGSIEVIPSMYLNGPRSSHQLAQIKQLYQLDVIALVSYDQIVNRKENLLAVTYLTIVGNYIFPGSHFNVNTLIDMALIDLDSKRLLFRAAGTAASKGVAAEAYTKHQYDKHQNSDFIQAMSLLEQNLAIELSAFEQRLRAKDPNDDIKVVARKGYDMSLDKNLLLLLMVLVSLKTMVTVRHSNEKR